jgi:hypothetical protein
MRSVGSLTSGLFDLSSALHIGQDAPQLRKYNEWIMLEPCEQFFKRDCALVAKALVEPKDCVPVRLRY